MQITLAAPAALALSDLATRLRAAGDVRQNEHLLRFRPTESAQELVVFPNGRAIVHGTDEPALAKSLYARYVGL